jgi:osmotically-inducible protein OsmY
MATMTLTDTDVRLRNSVVKQLDWDPEVDASGIGVAAKEGVVALTGSVPTYADKLGAERVAKTVRGVRGVANDLEVRLKVEFTDADIAGEAVRALKLRHNVPPEVQVAVHDGYVTLTGTVTWLFQSQQAEKAVRHVKGVRGVFNHITVRALSTASDVRHRIVEALHRNADLDARHIDVAVEGNVATIRGAVSSYAQYETAARACAAAPGITRVDNRLQIGVAEEVW